MKAQDYFYYMDLFDRCGFYKEADDVYSLVRTAQRVDMDDTILPGVVKNKGNKVPQNYNIYGRPTGWRSLPRNMNQGGGLDGTTVLPQTTSLITNDSVLDGDTILPQTTNRRTRPVLDDDTVLPQTTNRRTNPSVLDGDTILPQTTNRRTKPVSKTILDAFVDLTNDLVVKALDLQKAGKTIPSNLMSINAFEHNPGLHSLPGDPDAHLFLKLQIINNAFSSLDPRKDAIGSPDYSLNPKLFKQLAKKYFLPEILVNSFLADQSRENQVNQNRSAFFAKAAEIERLAANNLGAWNKFINNPGLSKMVNAKVLGMLKNLGTNSKALSQSLRQMPPQSPLWGLLEPALEFGLYQFGLYLENPSAYNLQSQEQSTISQLNTAIAKILADNKITDKKRYFMQNYGSTLKTLGTMEQSQLLNKFPVMPFNQALNIMKNIGQK